jgi:N utilization substance protein B
MSRRKARILALEALYAYEVFDRPVEELLACGWLDEEKRKDIKDADFIFARHLIAGTVENIARIDEVITAHIQNWDFSRLKRVDLAILRVSVYSLMFQKDIPNAIVIDEAIELCMRYSTDDSFKFVNAVLDAIKNNV